MLFLQLSSNSNHFSVIQQKPIFFGNIPPTWDENGPILSQVGGLFSKKIGFCWITEKWIELELSCKNNIFYIYPQLFNPNQTGLFGQSKNREGVESTHKSFWASKAPFLPKPVQTWSQMKLGIFIHLFELWKISVGL